LNKRQKLKKPRMIYAESFNKSVLIRNASYLAGQYAERALRDPAMYPVAIQMAIKENLISEEDVQPGGIDYKLLANGITAGMLTQELIR